MIFEKLKRGLKIVINCILGFIFIYFLLIIIFSLIEIPEKETTENKDITIYISTNGMHTDIVMPIKNEIFNWENDIKYENISSKNNQFKYIAIGWGDKGFYLNTPEWKDLKASVAFKAAFGLSSSAIHATFYQTMAENKECIKIMISKNQYKELVNYIQSYFIRDSNGSVIFIPTKAVYGEDDAFYEARRKYTIFFTCNTWANNALKKCGQKACFWTPFQQGIFYHYR